MTGLEDVRADDLNSSNVLYDFMFVTDADKIAHGTATVMPGVNIHDETQGTYTIAHWLMELVHWFLGLFHADNDATLFTAVYAVIVFLISYGVGWLLKVIILGIVRVIGPRIKGKSYDYLTDDHFFTKFARIVPPIVFLILIEFTLNSKTTLASWLTRLTWVYLSYVLSVAICVLADVMWNKIDQRENKRKLPLKGLVQLVKGIVWIVFAIITVAIILDKSPGSLLAGLGAFAAVLMLVFRDSILGVVAGVQLSENDSLHEGDWIAVSGTNANGVVTEVSLTAVKVMNWDKTTTTLPPYSLVSQGFTNYMSMSNSNTRRIQRSYMIDADSVVECDDVMLAEFAKIPLMGDWIAKKIEQRNAGKTVDAGNPDGLANGSIDTNLGCFRAYLKMWLEHDVHISKANDSDTLFVRTLPQTANGIPLEIYCFTATSDWVTYEAIQSKIFEHVAVMLYKFRLYTYESPSGRDTIIDGYICPGKTPADVFGMPWPFFLDKTGTPLNPPEGGTAEPGSPQPAQGG
ncbi:MAG: mechanosensitive ion channel family protein [Muribaculaceae bacterium]|nr:mechanosensitive ion channel family protein [Muribaculaceae bacterium]